MAVTEEEVNKVASDLAVEQARLLEERRAINERLAEIDAQFATIKANRMRRWNEQRDAILDSVPHYPGTSWQNFRF